MIMILLTLNKIKPKKTHISCNNFFPFYHNLMFEEILRACRKELKELNSMQNSMT